QGGAVALQPASPSQGRRLEAGALGFVRGSVHIACHRPGRGMPRALSVSLRLGTGHWKVTVGELGFSLLSERLRASMSCPHGVDHTTCMVLVLRLSARTAPIPVVRQQ